MVDEVEVKEEEVVAVPVADAQVVTVEAPVADAAAQTTVDKIEPEAEVDAKEVAEPHPALSLLDKLEAKLFFVETAIATEIKQVIEEIKSHL